MRGLIQTLGEKGWLRLGTVFFDDQPIAAQVWIVHAGHATIYKLAHDTRFDEYSAGSVLTARMLEHVLEVDRVQEVDFGSGDDAYKKNWLPYRRERWGIMAFNPRRVRGCLSILRHVGGKTVKSRLKGLVGRGRQEKAANLPSGSDGVE